MRRHGWTLLFHDCLIDQQRKLHDAVQRAQRSDPAGFSSNANVKLFRALSRLMLEVIPQDPSRDEYRQGGTLGPRYRHWRRARIGRRFRLFFWNDARAKAIVYAWVNDRSTLRSSGTRTDPNTDFAGMLARGHPPGDWASLTIASRQDLAVGEVIACGLR
ncbi:MAG: type II toxin-antitoxin system YhaV family toxin [Albidovulum sp.]|nr:type II toxin-antitoxin system YhaV family toxin [Albidovulum sp.]